MSDIALKVPEVIALVICDRVINDQRTGQRSLIGIVNAIGAMQFPVVHPIMGIYLALAGGRGRVNCEFRLVQEDSDKPPLRFPAALEFPPQADQMEIDIVIQGIPLHSPGRMLVQFWAEDRFLTERVVQIRQLQPPGAQAKPDQAAEKAGSNGTGATPPGASTEPLEKKDFVIRVQPENKENS